MSIICFGFWKLGILVFGSLGILVFGSWGFWFLGVCGDTD